MSLPGKQTKEYGQNPNPKIIGSIPVRVILTTLTKEAYTDIASIRSWVLAILFEQYLLKRN